MTQEQGRHSGGIDASASEGVLVTRSPAVQFNVWKQAKPEERPRPLTLPPDPAIFVGRERDVRQILDRLDPSGTQGRTSNGTRTLFS